MSVYHFDNVSAPVIIVDTKSVFGSPEKVSPEDKQVLNAIFLAGGAFSVSPPVSGIEPFLEAYPNGFDGEGNFPDECYIVGPRIIVADYIVEELDDQELLALIYHEDGHILNGDLKNTAVATEGFTILDDNERELAADAYAVRMSGGDKKLVATSIIKAVEATGKFMEATRKIVGGCTKASAETFVSAILSSDVIKQRLKALS
jgi:Zn-dependent protease with chaperone function